MMLTMTLGEWLKKKELNCATFAKLSGLSQPTIWRTINNKSQPTARTAMAIEKATKRQVKASKLLGL